MGIVFILYCKTENYQYVGYTIQTIDIYYNKLKNKVARKNKLREKGKPRFTDYIYENGGLHNWEIKILFDEPTGCVDELKRKCKDFKKDIPKEYLI